MVGDVCSYMRKGKDSTDLNELMDMMTKQWLQYPENVIFKIKFQTKIHNKTKLIICVLIININTTTILIHYNVKKLTVLKLLVYLVVLII